MENQPKRKSTHLGYQVEGGQESAAACKRTAAASEKNGADHSN